MDFGRNFRGNRILGDHKTWKGFFAGILMGSIVGGIQELAFHRAKGLLIGFLMGVGAMIGDIIKSFVKRRLEIKPGSKWEPWDSIDFVAGSILFSSIVFVPKISWIFIAFVSAPIVHTLLVHFEYKIGIRGSP